MNIETLYKKVGVAPTLAQAQITPSIPRNNN